MPQIWDRYSEKVALYFLARYPTTIANEPYLNGWVVPGLVVRRLIGLGR